MFSQSSNAYDDFVYIQTIHGVHLQLAMHKNSRNRHKEHEFVDILGDFLT